MIFESTILFRKKILDNPLKMKALQEHIETLKNAKKNKKKKKKKKKHRGNFVKVPDLS